MAVEQTSTISWYLRMFSYLLMICGLFGLAVGGVVIYGALADGAALRSLALAGVVASVFGLGLCYATGGQLPTSLIFNLLLMAICVVIAGNLGKSVQ